MTTAAPDTAFSSVAESAAPHVSRRAPLPATMNVRDARDAYLAENGFDTASYTAETFEVEAFGSKRTLPNTRDRKWAIPLHDLHHAATGYGTDLVGEAEVGAFELTGGCRTRVVYVLNTVAVFTGLVVAPLRTMRAFRAARGAKALFRQGADYDALLELSLGELRAKLGIPALGLASAPRRLHDQVENARRDALSSAPKLGGFALALAFLYGVTAAAVGLAEITRGGRLIGAVLAALGIAVAAGALSARKGALGARAIVGHAALGIATTSVVGASIHGAPLAALAAAPAILLLALLARG